MLIERSVHLAHVDAWLESDAGDFLVFEGPVGSGKSALLRACASRAAAAGALTLSAACAPVDQRARLGPLTRLFRNHRLPDWFRAEVDPVFDLPLGTAEITTTLARAVTELADEQPVLFCVDDLQHTDALSWECLSQLVDMTAMARVLLIASDTSARHPRARRITVPLLTAQGVESLYPGAGLFAVTAGNPLLVHALAQDETAYGNAVTSCLRRMTPLHRDVARLLAIRPVSTSDVELVLGAGAAAAHDDLARAGLAVTHPVAREHVLADMTSAERASLHRRLAALLHGRGAPAIEVAAHLRQAGDCTNYVPTVVDAASQLLREDRVAEAAALLELVAEDDRTPPIRTLVSATRWLLRPLAAPRPADPVEAARQSLWAGAVPDVPADAEFSAWLRLTHPPLASAETAGPLAALRHALVQGDVPAAQGLCRQLLTDRGTPWQADQVLTALQALIWTGAVEDANAWCAELSANTPVHQAILTAVRADTAYRRGEFSAAAQRAEEALNHLSPRAWGGVVGYPLGTLLTALARTGNHRRAEKLLSRHTPQAQLTSRFGVHHLHARGHVHLAAGRPRAALADFTRCGALLTDWSLDLPGLAPWRAGAAEAHLRLGEPCAARPLAKHHIADHDTAVRATALRLYAATASVTRRVKLLRTAAELLEARGDLFELSQVLRELGEAHSALGNHHRAKQLLHRGTRLAAACDAAPVPGLPTLALVRRSPAELTGAEHRVVSLAALGYTNREIAAQLHITRSTVEQHLTRVFRKLNVRCRSDLAAWLRAQTPLEVTRTG